MNRLLEAFSVLLLITAAIVGVLAVLAHLWWAAVLMVVTAGQLLLTRVAFGGKR